MAEALAASWKRYGVPAAIVAVAVAGAAVFWPRSAPSPEEPLPDQLGVAEQYGLSPAEISGLAPDALVRRALEHSTIEQLDAAAADDALSLGLLCLAQYYGEGAPRDTNAAARTCARGAERNAPGAGYVLAAMTRAGEGGLAADPAAADAILQKAADAGDARAQHEVAAALRPRRPAEARALAEQCAARGHVGCRLLVADMMAAGDGGPKDPAGARAAYEALAEVFVAPALRELGKMNRDGVGGPKNLDEAVLDFKRAAVLDDGEASYLLGQLAEQGRGVPKEEALTHYRAAAEDGYAPATAAVARLERAP